MVTITKGQAICMFYLEPYTDENVTRLTKTLDEMENLEICYLDEPTEPVFVHKLTINHNPFRYHKYISKTESSSAMSNETSEKVSLSNTAQLVQFLNIVYVTHNPNNNEVYDLKEVSMKQIISTAWDYCDFFDNKTVNSFAKWCLYQKLDLMQYQAKKRRIDGEEKIRTRNLYVVKNEYLDDVANKVVKHLPRYQIEQDRDGT